MSEDDSHAARIAAQLRLLNDDAPQDHQGVIEPTKRGLKALANEDLHTARAEFSQATKEVLADDR